MKKFLKIILVIALVIVFGAMSVVSGYYINKIKKIRKEVDGLQKHGLAYDDYIYVYVGLDSKVEKKGFTDAYDISIIELIANPQNYHKNQVLVEGIGHYDKNVACIYMTTEDYKVNNTKNAVFIFFDDNFFEEYKDAIMSAEGKNVLLVGTFNAMNNGPDSAYSGSLKNIKRYEESFTK